MTVRRTVLAAATLVACAGGSLGAQQVDVVKVESRQLERTVHLTGELVPFQEVALHARLTGFVDEVRVDRGSQVHKGERLVTLSAPEMAAQVAEARARARALDSQAAEARAKSEAADSTRSRLKAAAATPGAVAGNEVVQAEKTAEAARALAVALEESAKAAHAAADATGTLEGYLAITAPFDGTITDRLVHPGALVGPNTGPLLMLEQQGRLRLVIAVPEAHVASVSRGDHVAFSVPAFPGRTFEASVARIAGAIEPKTRTMAVELDVANPQRVLAPGMYPDVTWSLHAAKPSLLVPASSIVTTTERRFVVRVTDGRADWVDVTRGVTAGDLVEVFGALQPGDEIVRRGSDEIRAHSPVTVRRAAK